MKILFFTSSIPSEKSVHPSQSAPHIQSFHTIKELSKKYDISLQILFDNSRKSKNLEDWEKKLIEKLKRNIKVLNPIFLSKIVIFDKLPSYLKKKIEENVVYNNYKLFFYKKQYFKNLKDEYHLFFSYLCPESTSLLYGCKKKKISFEGDLHYQSYDASIKSLSANSIKKAFIKYYSILTNRIWRYLYCKFLNDYERVFCANLNAISSLNGKLKNNYFIGTLWPESKTIKKHKKKSKINILLSMGPKSKSATGNAINYITTRLIPIIIKRISYKNINFSVISSSRISDREKKSFSKINTNIKGWVKDINNELLECDIFVFLNNAGPIKAIFSRQIYAWSLGLCVLAHANSLKTMTQMKNDYNIMLGEDEVKIVDQMKKLIDSYELRKKIGQNGFKTYKNNFSPSVHTKNFSDYIESCL